jgi:hypothetical protein
MPIAWAGLLEAFVVMVSEKLILYPSIVYTPQDLVNRLRVSADRSIVIPEKGRSDGRSRLASTGPRC